MKHIKTYNLFENKNQSNVDEFYSVMQGTPEGQDFMKWFVIEPKRTGRIYVTAKRESRVSIPINYFDKISDNKWRYEYTSAGKRYGEQYGDLKFLFKRIIIDSIIKNLPFGIKKSEIEEFFYNNPIVPGTLPDKVNDVIDLFINSKRGDLIKDLSFIKEIPSIKNLTDTGLYKYHTVDNSILIEYNSWGEANILGISKGIIEILEGIHLNSKVSLNSMLFSPGSDGIKKRKDNYRGSGKINYKFVLGYKTEKEIVDVVEKEINKIMNELEVSFVVKDYEERKSYPVQFMEENLRSLIKTGKFLPDYKEKFADFISDLIVERIKKHPEKISLLDKEKEILDFLRNKRPDFFGDSEESTKEIIKGANVFKDLGMFDD